MIQRWTRLEYVCHWTIMDMTLSTQAARSRGGELSSPPRPRYFGSPGHIISSPVVWNYVYDRQKYDYCRPKMQLSDFALTVQGVMGYLSPTSQHLSHPLYGTRWRRHHSQYMNRTAANWLQYTKTEYNHRTAEQSKSEVTLLTLWRPQLPYMGTAKSILCQTGLSRHL